MGSKASKTKQQEKIDTQIKYDNKVLPLNTHMINDRQQIYQQNNVYEEEKIIDKIQVIKQDSFSHKYEQNRNSIDMDERAMIDEHTCNICYNIMVEPTILAPHCSHKFCIQCVQKFLQNKSQCPYCRVQIPKSFSPVIDVEFQKIIKASNKVQYEKRLKELELNGTLIGEQVTIEFEVGNYFKYLDLPVKSNNGDKDITMQSEPFVRFKDKACEPLIGYFIHSVTFKTCKCPNPNCRNNFNRRPKCNNCENCLKRNNGQFVEPNYEISCKLNFWEKLNDMGIEIFFTKELSDKEPEKCDCCDAIKKSSLQSYNTDIQLEWEQEQRFETIKVLMNKNKILKHLIESNEKLGNNPNQQKQAEKTAIEYYMAQLLQ